MSRNSDDPTQPGAVCLVTHVNHFVGHGAVARLLAEGMTVVCHDRLFEGKRQRDVFQNSFPNAELCASIEPQYIVEDMMDRFGRIDVLVSNDPYPAKRSPIDEASADDYRQALEALTVWPFKLVTHVAREMKNQKSGRIIFVSSAAPLAGIANYSMYAGARGATNALVGSLSKELARFGITVNAIAPNFIKNPDYFPPELLENEAALSKILGNIPLGRLGEPEEVAELIALFASGRCGFVTGHILPVAGGWA